MVWMLILIFAFAFSDTQDLIDTYCGGSVPCYLCTDGNEITQCYQNSLCTLGMQKCSLENLGELEDGKSSVSGGSCKIGIEVSNGKIRFISEKIYYYSSCSSGNFVDLSSNDFSKALSGGIFSVKYHYLYVSNGKLKYCYEVYVFGSKTYSGCGDWIEIGKDGRSQPQNSICYLESSASRGIRFVCEYSGNPQYGDRIPLKKSYKCPLGDYPCIQYSDGNYYCSKYQCYDVQNTPTENTDTPQGANDKQNDGRITSQGCVGTIYIMNGRDMRCRPPGTQTGGSNCCKKTRRWFGLANCSEDERTLARLRSWGRLDGNCHYVGDYCAEWWPCKSCNPKVCVQRKKTFCCFSSPLARIIHEYGRPQLGIGWGRPESPNCRGFTPEEFQKLDFSKIDFSEWIEEEVRSNITPSIQTSISNVLQNVQNQMGGNR